MSSWREIAARVKAEAGTCAVSANSAIRKAIGTNDTNGTAALPPAVQMGLRQLRGMAAPRIAAPEVWPEIVEDAARLANEGWAAQALALGWSPLHLWGCSPDWGGDPEHDGLAVWLAGRRVLLIDEITCIAEVSPRRRSIFHCRLMEGAVLLWELRGRGKAVTHSFSQR